LLKTTKFIQTLFQYMNAALLVFYFLLKQTPLDLENRLPLKVEFNNVYVSFSLIIVLLDKVTRDI